MGRREELTLGELRWDGTSKYQSAELIYPKIRDEAGDILFATGLTKPTNATTGYAKGCIFIVTGVSSPTCGVYTNDGTKTSCIFNVMGTVSGGSVTNTMLAGSITGSKLLANTVTSTQIDTGVLQSVEVDLTAAQIVAGTSIQLVASPGAGKYIQLLSATLSYTFGTAGFGGGGNVTLALGTTSITGLISAAASFGKGSNAIIQFEPLSAAAIDLSGLTATALNINVATGTFTLGTSTGSAKVFVTYQVHTA